MCTVYQMGLRRRCHGGREVSTRGAFAHALGSSVPGSAALMRAGVACS